MWKSTLALGVLFLTAACGANGAGIGQTCTAIGTPIGVTVDVLRPGVAAGTIEVCWDGTCATPALDLHPSTRVVEETCAGTGPDDACSARMEPTEGRNGFASLPDLPTRPVTVNLKLTDQAGVTVVDGQVTVTPEMAYANGPDCPAGGPQAGVSVGADGAISPR